MLNNPFFIEKQIIKYEVLLYLSNKILKKYEFFS